MAIILLACGPCVVIVNLLEHVLYLGRAPHTKETLPDFREWCRVTRHPRVFHWLMGYQRTPRVLGRHIFTLVRVRGDTLGQVSSSSHDPLTPAKMHNLLIVVG